MEIIHDTASLVTTTQPSELLSRFLFELLFFFLSFLLCLIFAPLFFLTALTTETEGKLHVARHDRHTAGVDSAQVCVRQQ